MERILVVDDDYAIRDVLVSLLQDQGYRVEGAASGPEALGIARRLKPQLILLDIVMPGMSGVETLMKLREEDAMSTIIMISGHPDREKVMQALDLGAHSFIQKPFDLNYLERVLLVKIAMGQAIEQILVVDDDDSIRDMLVSFLQDQGYGVKGAASGAEALALARRLKPQLILLDIVMPGMSGIETLKMLRKEDALSTIVMMSDQPDGESVIQALDLGADSFIEKPFDLKHLKRVLLVKIAVLQGAAPRKEAPSKD
jgi:DNA-binding response OmpR family regulator